jgi:hypothetical protein
MVLVFNITFNNISVLSWRTVLLVEDTGVSLTNFITYCASSTPYHENNLNLNRSVDHQMAIIKQQSRV